ncbi:MAG: hypothetical protein A6F71_09340 [Cycloclasticus sp. symbiont of Poecilosclerida sp. M]|nr:MAG: hypothetical protein A6F71_09340 [Cycloclasticus sp. symbiont of Poecilosclerida sp. M]
MTTAGVVQVLVRQSGKAPTLDAPHFLVAEVSGNLDVSHPLSIKYQWMQNGALLNETFFVLYFPSLVASHAGKYCCRVTITSPQLQDTVIATSIAHTLDLQEEHKENCASQGMYVRVYAVDMK